MQVGSSRLFECSQANMRNGSWLCAGLMEMITLMHIKFTSVMILVSLNNGGHVTPA